MGIITKHGSEGCHGGGHVPSSLRDSKEVAPEMERALFIPQGRRHLYGVLFSPESVRAPGGLVVCPPFADEAVHAHRPLVDLCRLLARNGVPTLYFDYAGTGDSEGAFDEASLRTYLDDIGAAARFLCDKAGVPRCGLAGLRLGAILAIDAAGHDPALSPLILWAPLSDVSGYFRTFLRRRLFTETTTLGRAVTSLQSLQVDLEEGRPVDVQGYQISPAMARDFATLAVTDGAQGEKRPVFLAEVGDGRERATTPPMARRLAEAGFSVTSVSVATEPFWEMARVGGPEALYQMTLDWLRALGW